MLYNSIFDLIGNTPLLKIPTEIHGYKHINLFAKLEYFNPFGSVKDRTAYSLIKDDIEEIKKSKKTLLESSSGNTAKALNTFASILGLDFKTISGRIKVEGHYQILKFLGADIQEIQEKGECPDPGDPDNVLTLVNKELFGNPEKYFYTDQYSNQKSIDYHSETTGREIWDDLTGKVDYFFAGLGTSGSSRGPATYIKKYNPDLKVIGVVADPSDVIPGIRNSGELLEVGLFQKYFYHSFEEVSSLSALDHMRYLIKKVGIYSGPTGGATYAAVLKYLEKHAQELPEGTNIVFVVCDRFEFYLPYIQQRKPEFFGNGIKESCIFYVSKEQELSASSLLASELFHNLQDYLIIDTRTNFSFRNFHIPSSINLDYDNLIEMSDDKKLPFSKSKKIVLVCPIGKKTKKLAAYLQFKGYSAFFLEGGLQARISQGYQIEKF